MNDIIELLAPEPVEPDPRWAATTLRRIQLSKIPRRRRRKFLAAGAAVVIAFAGGAAAFANHGSDDRFSRDNPANARAYQEIDARKSLGGPVGMNGQRPAVDDNALTTAPWEKNEYGLTVGEPTSADVALRNLPDLMPTFTVKGGLQKTGYFRSEEFYVYAPTGELENTRDVHNVYGADGRTLLGTR